MRKLFILLKKVGEKVWRFKKKSYLCIRFRLKNEVIALKREFFERLT